MLVAAWVALPKTAEARTLEPGKLIGFAELGPTFLIDSRLGGSSTYLLLGAGLEYPFAKNLSAVGGVAFGLSGSQQLKLRAGGRFRWAGLDLPVSPYGEAQLVAGRLFDIIGSDLGLYGVRVGAGVDYFLTAKLLAGLKAGYELSRTTGPNPVTFGQFELLVTASLVF